MIQIVHYFYTYFRVIESQPKPGVEFPPVRITVPSGAFGNCAAGWMAKTMGLPIDLMASVNKNDILHSFFTTGELKKLDAIHVSAAPAMDIGIPYNFERWLYLVSGRNAQKTQEWMKAFEEAGSVRPFPTEVVEGKQPLHKAIQSCSCSDEAINATMAEFALKHNYLLDPHSATAVHSSCTVLPTEPMPTCCLLTAHPAKFGEAVKAATGGITPEQPPCLHGIAEKPILSCSVSRDQNWLQVMKTYIATI